MAKKIQTPEQRRLDGLTAIVKNAQSQIEEMKASQNREENGPKVGKFFVQTCEGQSPTYAVVTHMDENGWLYANLFERDKTGNSRIYIGHLKYYMHDWRRISPAVYTKAKRALLLHIYSII